MFTTGPIGEHQRAVVGFEGLRAGRCRVQG